MRLLFGVATVLFLPALVAVALLVGSDSPRTEAAPLHGAIFTTTPDGGIVNENVRYEQKIEVYLDGGPPQNAPKTAGGLPDGEYVFQVTDPSGKVLLSEDPAQCRIVRVTGGIIVDLLDWDGADIDPGDFSVHDPGGADDGCHIQDPPNPPNQAGPDDAGASGQHDTNVDVDHGADGAIVVQLMPFFDTPNPGGVYKAWVIPLFRYVANHPDGEGNLDETPDAACERRGRTAKSCNGNSTVQIGFVRDDGFGPPRDQVKTDNFKVKEFETPMLHVRKFHDINGDGIWQQNDEPEIGQNGELGVPGGTICVQADGTIAACNGAGGWPIEITEPITNGPVTNNFFTPAWVVAEPSGDWLVCEGSLDGWTQSAAYLDDPGQTNNLNTQCVTVQVSGDSGESHEVIFGNFMPPEIHGTKFIDLNANGENDGEGCPASAPNNAGCEGITIHLIGVGGTANGEHDHTTTDDMGDFWFMDLLPGDYHLCEEVPAEFIQSVPSDGPDCSSHAPNDNNVVRDIGIAVSVSSGDVSEDNDFGNFSLAEVHGTKYIDLNANGQQDQGEGCNLDPDPWGNNAGCQGVTINLDGMDGMDGEVHLETTTGADGDYWFVDLKPGSYTVTVTEPAGFFCSDPDPCQYELTLISDEVSENNDFGDFSLVDIHGTKYIDLNANGQQDPGEGCNLSPDPWGNNTGCQGVTINLDGTDGMGGAVNLTTTTNDDGDYWFLDLKPGIYALTVSEPAGFFCSDPDPCRYDLTLISDEVSENNDFGDFSLVDIHVHKFFDLNENGVQDGLERDLEGIEFCLYEGATADPGNLVSCQTTDADGMIWWMDLMPGTYTMTETLPSGFFGTTPTTVTVVTISDEVVEREFGNVADCDGLTPGYWKNWRNHYTESQILTLLAGTIAPTIAEADAIFAAYNASPDEEITIMRAMLLANQLTLNLTQHPELPNPSGGSLFRACQAPGVAETLGEIIDQALAIHANPGAFSRDEILRVKTILDTFANLNS